MKRSWTLIFVTLSMGLAAALLQVWPGSAAALEFERSAVAAGEWWRLITCHLPHESWDHLFWSGGAFVLLGVLTARQCGRALIPCVLCSAAAVGLAVWLETDLRTYRGLSGIDSALFVLLAINLARSGSRACWGLLGLFAVKVVYEVMTGRAVFVDSASSGMVPVPLAHAAGAVVGLLFSVRWSRGRRGSSTATGQPAVVNGAGG